MSIFTLNSAESHAPMPTKILTVDDSLTLRSIVSRAFHSYEVIIFEGTNGRDGLVLAAKEKPDLILLDIAMPVMDGVTMLNKLKEDPELKLIPVIMLTAESGRENLAEIAVMGARDVLVKPFKEAQLIEKAGRIISLKKKIPSP
jgi:two-component system, cell cycle response regulator